MANAFSRSDTGGTVVYTYGNRDGSASGVATSPAMDEALDALGAKIAAGAARLQPAAAQEQAIIDAAPAIRQLGADIRAAGAAAADLAERRRIGLTPPTSIPRDRAPEWRRAWHGLSDTDQVMRAQAAEAEELAALREGGRQLAGVTNDHAWATIEERALHVFHVIRAGMQANFAATPTVDRLIVHGPDAAAAERAAGEVLARFRAEQKAMATRETHLQSALALLSVVTGRPTSTVLAEALA